MDNPEQWTGCRYGVRFNKAYVAVRRSAPVGMSFYTGALCALAQRAATWKRLFQLGAGEPTLGDQLARKIGADLPCWFGKTSHDPGHGGMRVSAIDRNRSSAVPYAELRLHAFERMTGLHPERNYDASPPYDDYLRGTGVFDATTSV